jgi:hypothetical protein
MKQPNKEEKITVDQIRNLMGLRRINERRYSGVFATGNFNLFDYDVGLLQLSISVIAESKDTFCVLLSISTIDDGVWQALEVSPNTKKHCIEKMEKVATALIESEYKTKLPSEAEFNKFLAPFGMWGEYTG